MKTVVFDLGGTLTEYVGMPNNWAEYYLHGFNKVDADFNLSLSNKKINQSIEILKSFNPRINYREIEYSPEYIFSHVIKNWNATVTIEEVILSFFQGLNLNIRIYDDVLPCLTELQKRGYKTAVLTDLPTAMPDELFRCDIDGLLRHFDLYVSSVSCGYRKPNKNGMLFISEYFSVKPEDIIFIGDEEKDKLTAQNAGCKFIGLMKILFLLMVRNMI